MNSNSSPPMGTGSVSVDGDAPAFERFQCCVCLDLLYKPIVLACGHISCFWCVQNAMHGLRASHCPLCRKPYNYFPSICELLHYLLLKIEPIAYKTREKEVLEEETRRGCFSPELSDKSVCDQIDPGQKKPIDCEENKSACDCDGKENGYVAFKEAGLPISVIDVLCCACKEILVRPAVLNCGHVYCESCISTLTDRPPRCQVCESLHPGDLPSICLDLDQFVQLHFPTDYAVRKLAMELDKVNNQDGNTSCSTSSRQDEKENGKSNNDVKDFQPWLDEEIANAHVGVGCDSCGMYPIIGKRYKCKDCTEKIGFDLCDACYSTKSKLPGRFNQQHKPDHKFVLDESQMLCKILMLRSSLPEELPIVISSEDMEDNVDHYDFEPLMDGNEDTGDRNNGDDANTH